MSGFEHLRMHPERPQIRQIRFAAEMLRKGAFAVVPTETTYTLMMLPESNQAQEAVRQLRRLDKKHLWSLMCQDLSQAAQYVKLDNQAHRLLKRCLPGAFTFILPANTKLPKRVFGNRKDIGIRMSSHVVCRSLLNELDAPLLTTTLQFPDEELVAHDPDEIRNRCKHLNVVLLDVGWGGVTPTTVVDLCDVEPKVIRSGLGEWPLD